MGRAKCQICRKDVNTKTGFKISKGSRNLWYCNKQEYLDYIAEQEKEKQFKEDLHFSIDLSIDITLNSSWRLIDSKIKTLRESYSREEILWYFDNNIDNIAKILRKKAIADEYKSILYFMAIVNNNIQDYLTEHPVVNQNPQTILAEDFYMAPSIKYVSHKRRAMKDIEEDDEDE